jgi:hypothetical protein
LDQPPLGEPSGSYLGGEGIWLEGLMSRPMSPQAPRASEGICPFVSCPVHDLIGGVGDSVAFVGWGGIEEPPEPWALGRLVLARPLAQTRVRVEDQARVVVTWEPEARASPRVLSRGRGGAWVSTDP